MTSAHYQQIRIIQTKLGGIHQNLDDTVVKYKVEFSSRFTSHVHGSLKQSIDLFFFTVGSPTKVEATVCNFMANLLTNYGIKALMSTKLIDMTVLYTLGFHLPQWSGG